MEKYNLPVVYSKLTSSEKRKVREQYVVDQRGLCYHCKYPLNNSPSPIIKEMKRDIDWRLFPRGFLKHPIHLHHSHETGLTLGSVHSLCNAVLWQFHGE